MSTLHDLPDLSKARLLVVGDVMLDRYWFGEVSRISPEAPVPVVKVERSEERPALFLAAGGTTWENIGPSGGYSVGTSGDGFRDIGGVDRRRRLRRRRPAGDRRRQHGRRRVVPHQRRGRSVRHHADGGLVATGDLLGASVAAGERPGNGSWVVAGAPGAEDARGVPST